MKRCATVSATLAILPTGLGLLVAFVVPHLLQMLPLEAQGSVPAGQQLSETGWDDNHPAIALGRDGRAWVTWIAQQGGADTVAVSDGGHLRRVTDTGYFRAPAIAVDGRGWIRSVWPQKDVDEYHLYESVYLAERWTRAARLTAPGTSNIAPVMAADASGKVALAWQSLRDGQSVVMLRVWDGRNWGAEQQVSQSAGNAASPAVAWGSGRLWVVWDAYVAGNYQVYARSSDGADLGVLHRVNPASFLAMRPSVVVTATGVPVVAWEESDAGFGNDFAFLDDRFATTILNDRRISLARFTSGRWIELPSPTTSLDAELRQFFQQPQLALDPAGRLFLAFRVRLSAGTITRDFGQTGGRFGARVTQLEGERWRPAVELPSSTGSRSMRVVAAAGQDRIHLAWSADHRASASSVYPESEVFTATLPSVGKAPGLGR